MYALLQQHPPEFLVWLPLVQLGLMIIGGGVLLSRVNMALDRFLDEVTHLETMVNEHEKKLAVITTMCRYNHPDSHRPVNAEV